MEQKIFDILMKYDITSLVRRALETLLWRKDMAGEVGVFDRVQAILRKASGPGDEERVKTLEQEGLDCLFGRKGAKDIEKALDSFLAALQVAGSNTKLCFRALTDIGDWARRVPGHLDEAEEIFKMALPFAGSKIASSRLKAMWAMIYSFETERTNVRQPELDKNISMLKEAIADAQEGYASDPVGAFEADCLATHRLLGTLANWGTPQEQRDGMAIAQRLLPTVPAHSPEWYRLRYPMALIRASEHPSSAVAILEECANGIESTSPIDAVGYRIKGAQIALAAEDQTTARKLYERAEQDRPLLSAHSNASRYIEWLDELRTKLKTI